MSWAACRSVLEQDTETHLAPHSQLLPSVRALRWAGDLSRVYSALTQSQLGLAPATTPRPHERDKVVTDMTTDMIKPDSVFNNNFILPCSYLKDYIKGRLQVDNTVAVILSVAFDNITWHAMANGSQVVTQFWRVQLYGNYGNIVEFHAIAFIFVSAIRARETPFLFSAKFMLVN